MGQYVQESYSSVVYYSEKRQLGIVGNVDYRAHTRPLFHRWKALGLYDIVQFNSMVFMFKVYANLLPGKCVNIS